MPFTTISLKYPEIFSENLLTVLHTVPHFMKRFLIDVKEQCPAQWQAGKFSPTGLYSILFRAKCDFQKRKKAVYL
jgi:hypothetical protein